ncbi:RNA 3'-terminal phosphate cyclase type 2 domain-containing protein [Rozella allomycis CSF55]|uniref:RNA 3'-terminal phosphate cyclase type 2 domain-containing protein n=1 Tax=Rozella allomycis (strain CSF55) TaxID=988480 RepID=A0A075B366_ROZAC|nr:RNA 3'-terminal phosphate cyclase type 2 domain-containing protein [Rozella allomycis CSF55]|eukprot:EPZ35411.1 RNA 3'-terminal phosphate cyclase type 2 domain-containing protein [Rozella allomycis CSF55]
MIKGSHQEYLTFQGSSHFRQRIMMSALSQKAVKIEKIRSNKTEIKFLKLIEAITNGSTVQISYTGTSVVFRPGVLVGGKVTFDATNERCVTYWLEPLLAIAPFCKEPVLLTIRGVTNNDVDCSVDAFRTVLLPVLKQFGIAQEPEFKRGYAPMGGGEVFFKCPVVKQLKPLEMLDCGKIKRIRGIAHASRVTPQMANRMVDGARSVLNQFIPDIYVHTDVFKGHESGKSPGYGIILVAESTTGVLLSSEMIGEAGQVPEEMGKTNAARLLQQIEWGGCFDASCQWLVLLLMVLCPEDVSKVRFGKLTDQRDLKKYFGVKFKIEADHETETVVLGCVGIGYINYNKNVT